MHNLRRLQTANAIVVLVFNKSKVVGTEIWLGGAVLQRRQNQHVWSQLRGVKIALAHWTHIRRGGHFNIEHIDDFSTEANNNAVVDRQLNARVEPLKQHSVAWDTTHRRLHIKNKFSTHNARTSHLNRPGPRKGDKTGVSPSGVELLSVLNRPVLLLLRAPICFAYV